MQQQDQQSAGPAQPSMFGYRELLGKNGEPAASYLAACDPRCVFEDEAELEYTIGRP